MTDFNAIDFSGGVSGAPILVAATATAGTLIHTAHATGKDEIYLYATNNSASAVFLTIEFGGVAAKDNIRKSIPANTDAANGGLILIIPGLRLTGSLVIRAFAGTTNVIAVSGTVNRAL